MPLVMKTDRYRYLELLDRRKALLLARATVISAGAMVSGDEISHMIIQLEDLQQEYKRVAETTRGDITDLDDGV